VALFPSKRAAKLPSVYDVTDQKKIFTLNLFYKFEQFFSLAIACSKVNVGYKYRFEIHKTPLFFVSILDEFCDDF
jgi:hypothetical protein